MAPTVVDRSEREITLADGNVFGGLTDGFDVIKSAGCAQNFREEVKSVAQGRSSDIWNSLQSSAELLVFQTNFVDQFGVGYDALLQRDPPRFGVGLGIVNRHPDFEMSEIPSPDLFSNLGCAGEHAAAPVDPRIVAHSDRVDHERVAGPLRR
jgi:hypothetical protein